MNSSSGETSLFTDLTGGSAALAARHRAVAADVLERVGGVEPRTAGNGVAATLADPQRALMCAVQIQRSFEDWGSSTPAVPVRVGLDIDDAGAAAVAAKAEGGDILVTDAVRALTAPRGHLFTARGEVRLGGTAVPVFALRWWEHD